MESNTIGTTQAEINEAMEQEKIARISDEGMELISEYQHASREATKWDNEKKAIGQLLTEEAKSKNAVVLTYDGRDVFELVSVTRRRALMDELKKDYPELYNKYVVETEGTRIDVKR